MLEFVKRPGGYLLSACAAKFYSVAEGSGILFTRSNFLATTRNVFWESPGVFIQPRVKKFISLRKMDNPVSNLI
jgi:hypothetical protein